MFRFSKAFFTCFLSFVLIFSCTALAVIPSDYNAATPEVLEPGHLYGKSCIVMNANTGDVLLEKDADTQRYPASTTKIMTCILGLESDLVNTVVTIPDGISVDASSSKMGISIGDRIAFNDLLCGMMLASGNDAALAVAKLVSGSVESFVREMNIKAKSLGMTGTNYVNPHGLHKVNHYTTARDLATLMSYALQNEQFCQIISTVEANFETVYHPTGWSFTTKYDLLIPGKQLYYDASLGGKTGYVKAAGRCFVGAARQGNITLVTVTLFTDPNDDKYSQAYTDTIRLSKYGFAQYTSMTFDNLYALCDEGLFPSVKVEKALSTDITKGVLRKNDLIITDLPATYRELYLKSSLADEEFQEQLSRSIASRLTFEFDQTPTAPIAAGDILGTVKFASPSGEVITGKLVAGRDVELQPPTVDEVMDNWIDSHAPWVAYLMPRRTPAIRLVYWLLLIGIVALIIARIRRVRRRNALRRRQYERKRREALMRQKQREAYLRAHPEARGKTRQSSKRK